MKIVSTLVLRLAILALGAGVLALCVFALPAIWQDVPNEYSRSPEIWSVIRWIIVAMYVSALPFFLALYQAMRLLTFIDKQKAFSMPSVNALNLIAYSGVAISLIYTASLPLTYLWAQDDDAPGLIVLNMLVVGGAFTVTVFAAVMQRLLKQVIDIKSEHDLTV